MEKSNLTKIIFSKKTSDYTFAVLFLLIFSIFIVFAIRPSLTTAASLKKEEKDLLKIDALYENKIMDIALVQSQIEENRDSLFLLNDAVSEYPQVNKMIEDVKKIADENDLFIKKASIADVTLLKNQKSIDKISMIVEGSINFDNLVKFTDALKSQRRLKTVDKMIINRDIESTESSQLKVVMTINGYYL